jgi:hypothetical protein
LDAHGEPTEDFSKKVETVANKTVKFIFTNYNITTGIGTKEPIKIFSSSETSLYINYIISGYKNRSSKNVLYTIYEVENAKQEADKIDALKNQ